MSRSSVGQHSFDKIVGSYFAIMTREPIEYRGKIILPKPLHVSPLIFRHYTCPPNCGACCPRFELIYLPSDPRPLDEHIIPTYINFNGSEHRLLVDAQDDHRDHFCRNLIKSTGRCGVHGYQPFSCDFELLRGMQYEYHNVLMQRLYGRGWNMLKIDDTRGALCEMIEQTIDQRGDLVRRLKRLKTWCDYFGFISHIDTVIEWCETGPHAERLILNTDGSRA